MLISEAIQRIKDYCSGIDMFTGKPIEERHPGQYLSLPLEEFNARAKNEIPADRPVALVCNTGTRAYEAQLKLRNMGIETVNSAGGHTALRKRGDEEKF